jgi:hypothetical protein
MSTHVIFLRDKTDLQYQKFLKVLLACKEAGIDLPKEVDDYFGGDGLDNDPEEPLQMSFEPREWISDMSEGFEIDINEIPPGVKTIRFYNSW